MVNLFKPHTNFLIISLVLFTVFHKASRASASYSKQFVERGNTKVNPQLVNVFVNETDSLHKLILKLYDDQTYEFLKFIKFKTKLNSKRETGEYHFKGKKLILKSRNKKIPFEHSSTYYFTEETGLYETKKKQKQFDTPILALNKEKRFCEEYFTDPVFGKISNNKKIPNKLNDPLFAPKPTPTEIKQTQAFRDTTGNYLFQSALNEKGIKLSIDTLRRIKAVIVVGPVESSTKHYIDEQKEVADFLKTIGVQVKEFYYPNANWEDIKEGSKDANIFIYSGHGITLGEKELSGTLYLAEGLIYSEHIIEGLKLHKNSLVIFNHACSSAGSSASDRKDIGIKEAVQRVGDYAKPFIKLNAGGYYANNYCGSTEDFLMAFFTRLPIKKIYAKKASEYTTIEYTQKYAVDKKYEISVASKKPDNSYIEFTKTFSNGKVKKEKVKEFKSYDIAYVGIPDFTVTKFFEE